MGEGKSVYSIPPYSSKPPESGQEACPKIWQPRKSGNITSPLQEVCGYSADSHYPLFLFVHYWMQQNATTHKKQKQIQVKWECDKAIYKVHLWYKDLKWAEIYTTKGMKIEDIHLKKGDSSLRNNEEVRPKE